MGGRRGPSGLATLAINFVFVFVSWAAAAVETHNLSSVNEGPACEEALSGSDVYALHAHAVGSLLNISTLKDFLGEISGESAFRSGYRLKARASEAQRAVARMKIHEMIERLGYKDISIEDFGNGANIVVERPGTVRDDEVLEITAHYDSVVTGADDNGSGVTLMLTMLSLLKDCQHERRIRFVFTDLEERGMQGSRHHAARVKATHNWGRKFVGAMVLDTIGWTHPESKRFLAVMEVGEQELFGSGEAYARRLRFAKELYFVLAKIGDRDRLFVSPEIKDAQPSTSDLGSYFYEDLPAVLVAAPFEKGFVNPYYHREGDTMGNMNWEYLREMAVAIVEMAAYTAKTKLTDPDRLSEKNWAVLRELENREVSMETFELPDRGRREEFLEPNFRRRAKEVDDMEEDDFAGESDQGAMTNEGGPSWLSHGGFLFNGSASGPLTEPVSKEIKPSGPANGSEMAPKKKSARRKKGGSKRPGN